MLGHNNKTTSSSTSLNLSHRKLQSNNMLYIISRYPQLKRLDLSDNQIDWYGVYLLAHLTTLTDLNLAKNHDNIFSSPNCILTQLASLTALDITHNKIDISHLQSLTRLTKLRGLRVRPNNLLGIALVDALAQLTMLTRLSLIFSLNEFESAQGLTQLTNLTHLDLPSNRIGAASASLLALLTKLTHLDLEDNQIIPDDIQTITRLNALTYLRLTRNNISHAGVLYLTQLACLTLLDLSRCGLNDADIHPLTHLTRLSHLYLIENNIRTNGAQSLGQLFNLTNLNLHLNTIGDNGASALTQLSKLSTLHLRLNEISQIGAQSIAKLSTLTDLDLFGNDIRLAGLQTILQLPNLTDLKLGFTDTGPAGAHALSLHPHLRSLELRNINIGDEGAKAFLTNTRILKLDMEDEDNPFQRSIAHTVNDHIDNNNNGLHLAREQLLETFLLLTRARNTQDGNFWGRLPAELALLILQQFTRAETMQYWFITPQQLISAYQRFIIFCAENPSNTSPYPYSRVQRFLQSLPGTLYALETAEEHPAPVMSKTLAQNGLFKTSPVSTIDARLSAEIEDIHQISLVFLKRNMQHLIEPATTPEQSQTYLCGCDVIRLQLAAVLNKVKQWEIQDPRIAQLKIIHDRLQAFSTALQTTSTEQTRPDRSNQIDQTFLALC
jgi:internalin A